MSVHSPSAADMFAKAAQEVTAEANVVGNAKAAGAAASIKKAEIGITGVWGDRVVVEQLLRERGFLISHVFKEEDETYTIAVALGPRLLLKCALIVDLPRLKEGTDYKPKERARLAEQAILIIQRSDLVFTNIFLLHDRKQLKELMRDKSADKVDAYFGSGVAMYFAWQRYYTWALVAPAGFGLLLFLREWIIGDRDDGLVPAFCIVVAMWSTVWLQFWKRENSKVALKWDVHGVEEETNLEAIAEKAGMPKTSPATKYGITVPIIFMSIYFVIKIMLYCIELSNNAYRDYPATSPLRYWPLVIYSVVPLVCSEIYTVLANKLNAFEEHPTAYIAKRMLIIKMFAFQFVNCYSALFYACFVLQDMAQLRGMLFTLTFTKQIVGNMMEIGIPKLKRKWAKRAKLAKQHLDQLRAVAPPAEVDATVTDPVAAAVGAVAEVAGEGVGTAAVQPASGNTAVVGGAGAAAGVVAEGDDSNATKVGVSLVQKAVGAVAADAAKQRDDDSDEDSDAESESDADDETMDEDEKLVKDFTRDLQSPEEVIEDDYLEMVIQFGYCSMFAVAFPLAPLCALVNNYFEYRIDLAKLGRARRPLVSRVSNIGGWMTCLEVMAIFATITNCFILALVSDTMSSWVPTSLESLTHSTEGKVLLGVLLEHVLLLIRHVLNGLIDETPLDVREKLAVQQLKKTRAQREHRMLANNALVKLAKKKGGDLNDMGLPKEAAKELQNLKKESNAWSVSPLWLTPLAVLPYVVGYMEWKLIWVLPVSFILLSYAQNMKDQADVAFALGVVQSPTLIKLITSELPGWYTDSEVERAEWLNKVLKKAWKPLSGAVEALVVPLVQPILDSCKPGGITALDIKRLSLGLIAPKIVGVRVLDMEEGCVSLDLEIKWAGDSSVLLAVGRKGLPLMLELKNIKLSCKPRIDFVPLVPMLPCFGALCVTFMERPYIDFNFKVGSLDVMSIGPAEKSLGTTISNIIKDVLANWFLYPKKLVIPILDDIDIRDMSSPPPSGVLQLRLVKADNLVAKDIGLSGSSSDPYVVVKLGDSTYTSKTIKNCLNPKFDETFEFMAYDRATQTVYMELFDHDTVGNDETLGKCELRLAALKDFSTTTMTLPLHKTSRGSLTLQATYIPLETNEPEPDPDVLYEVNDGEDPLTDDIVLTAKEALPPVIRDEVEEAKRAQEAEAVAKKHKKRRSTFGSTFSKMSDKMSKLGDKMSDKMKIGHKDDDSDSDGDGAEEEDKEDEDKEGRSRELVAGEAPAEQVESPIADPTDLGVLTCVGMELSGIEPAKCRLTFRQGNASKKTAYSLKASLSAFTEVFHFIIRGRDLAMLEVVVKSDSRIGDDTEIGHLNLRVADVVHNNNEVERSYSLDGAGAGAKGELRMRLKYHPAKVNLRALALAEAAESDD